METTAFLQSKSLFSTLKQTQLQRHKHILKPSSTIVSVLTRPADHNIIFETESTDSKGRGRAENTSTIYNDNWFDRIAINHLSQSVQAATGLRNEKSGYESLVEAATAVSKNFDPIKQRELVKQALQTAFPRQILSMIKTLLPQSKLAREYFAVFTTLFFAWLVGPCEVRESEFNGRREKNVVHIKKCRFLEESNCVSMCTNLCMIPSQTFIKDSLGMQLNMVPNFEDMSCEMKFGEDPPAFIDDPALKQPCYKLCKVNRRHHTNCSS